MSDDTKKITFLDDKRVDHLTTKGHYLTMIEDFETLRLKLIYDDELSKKEAIRLVTLTKYFLRYGHSEAFKLSCKYLYERFMEPFGL